MSNDLSQLLKNNWDKIQERVQKEWNLNKDDLQDIGKSYDKLVAKIKDEYGYTEKQIKDKLNSFLEDPDVKNLKEQIGKVKEQAGKALQESYEDVKNKLPELQTNITRCIQNHPIKSLSIALVGGLLLARLLK